MSQPTLFKLIMLSAWHEQGGNYTHRLFDSHPQCITYPFESLLGTPLSRNLLCGPDHPVGQRYAYPAFDTSWDVEQVYDAFDDRELKTYLRTPKVSKFRDCGMVMDEEKRRAAFVSALAGISGTRTRCRPAYIEAFFRATDEAWTNRARLNSETHYVGYSPPIHLDADRFFEDFPEGHMVQVIRNPFSGYADHKKRAVPLSLERYCDIWNVCAVVGATNEITHRFRYHQVLYESLIDPRQNLKTYICLLYDLGLQTVPQMPEPSFNRAPLLEGRAYPWGTIGVGNESTNRAAANSLTNKERIAISERCGLMLRHHYSSTEWAHY